VAAPGAAAAAAGVAGDDDSNGIPGSRVRERRRSSDHLLRDPAMNTPLIRLPLLGLIGSLLLLGCTGGHQAENKQQPDARAQEAGREAAQPATAFKAPDEAATALAAALRANDTPRVLAILGPGGQDIISSGDDVADQERRQKFLSLYDQKHTLAGESPDRRTLVVGNDDWPLPIPIVKQGEGWRFDSEAAKEEILNRRIGENELSAIQVCKAIGDAQRDFALRDPDGDGLEVYAPKFFSDPGKRNGLYYPTAEGEEPSPLGELVAEASAEGYKHLEPGPTPYHGYFYRLLTAQGPHAPNGAVDYLVNGRMALGFAVVAWPAEYGNSGVMTFIMGPDGVVYQQNLGEETAKLASEMKAFDPDEDWKKVE
jgi:hypothetical protein